MFDILDFEKKFENNKEAIIEALIEYYGQEYAEIIREKVEDTVFIFISDPEEEYKYVESHKDQVSNALALMIKARYYSQKEIEEEIRQEAMDELFKNIKHIFFKGRLDDKNKEIVLKLFTDENLNSGFIDALSTRNINQLNSPKTPATYKESIRRDIAIIKQLLKQKLKMPNINPAMVDRFIEYREKLQAQYNDRICKETPYARAISNIIFQKYNIRIPTEYLDYFVLKKESFTQSMSCNRQGKKIDINVIRVSILYLINQGVKGLDTIILHEIIHRIETCIRGTGLTITNSDKNIMINEVRTEYTATKIATKMHEAGIFIFDNPKNYINGGEAIYNILLPITEELIDGYEKFFADSAINNEPERLDMRFGESWDTYSKLVDKIFEISEAYIKATGITPPIKKEALIKDLIDEMISYEKRGNKHV